MNCSYPAHICKSNQPCLKPIVQYGLEFKSLSIQATKAKKYNLEKLTLPRKGLFNYALRNRV